MKTICGTDKLVVSDEPKIGWILILLGLTGSLCLFLASSTDPDSIKGIFATLLFAAAGVVFLQKSLFEFEAKSRYCHWRKTWLMKKTNGKIFFDDIEDLVLESNDESYRLVLKCKEMTLPMTDSFYTDKEKLEATRKQILDFVKIKASNNLIDTLTSQVRLLVENGKEIEAIKLVRDTSKCSLAEARQHVVGLRSSNFISDNTRIIEDSRHHDR